MERSSFFDATLVGETYDRVYLADDFARYFASFIGNGVFPTPSTNLQVVQDVNMQVKLKAGKGWINGRFYELTEDLTLNVAVADGVLKRKDRVVLRLDFINREIKAYLKKGAFSSSPVAPTLTRTADIYELGIADILINNGVTSIAQANITDLRQNNTYCGLVAGVVQQIDTTNLFTQFESAFNVWFEAIKGQLSTDVAGNLQNQINLIQPLVDSWEDFKDNGGTLFNSLTINNLDTVTDQVKTSKLNLIFGLGDIGTSYKMNRSSFSPNFLNLSGDNPTLGNVAYPFQDLILRNIGSVKGAIIVESGSNANGSYVKFGDRTMICHNTLSAMTTSNTMGSAFYSPLKSWTYPVAFTSAPRIYAMGTNLTVASGANNGSLHTGVVQVFGFDSTGRSGGAYVFAIGAWK